MFVLRTNISVIVYNFILVHRLDSLFSAQVFTQRTRTDCTPASSRFSLAAPRREGSSDLSHECRDVSQYPPTPVNAKEAFTYVYSNLKLYFVF